MALEQVEETAIGVTLSGDVNKVLKRIKDRTGLSVSRLANLGLGFLAPRILKGEFQIVNGEIVAAEKEAKKR